MDNFGQALGGQLKQVAEIPAKAIETLVTAGQAPQSAVSPQEQGASGGSMAQQIAQKDAQDLARARQKLANFNATLAQTYSRVKQEEEQIKQIQAQEEHQDKVEESEKKRAQDEAMRLAQAGGGGEGQSREAK